MPKGKMNPETFKGQIQELLPQIQKYAAEAITPADKERVHEMVFLANNYETMGCGSLGIIRELLKQRHDSLTTTKACDQRQDVTLKFSDRSRVNWIEVKSNSGCVEYLLKQEAKGVLSDRYTVYCLRQSTVVRPGSNREPEWFTCPPVVLRNDKLLQILRHFNLINPANNCINSKNKQFMQWLSETQPGTPWEMERVYSVKEFEAPINLPDYKPRGGALKPATVI